ncbi:hypothetical protein [Deinococcus sp.]|uniref:hypothetical protein n=1 Tax=Deinococcus sp. TaxID=47478 RepID=UPI0025D10E79|nr:hypothetical protein [Deinococcus sp.]
MKVRVVLAVLVLGLVALYFTIGVRLGYVTVTPLYLFNAQGQTSYPFRLYDEGKLVVNGQCEGRSGLATLRFLSPDGTELSSVKCPPGKWSLDMSGEGTKGIYTLVVDYKKYSGSMELNSSYKTKY